MPRQFKSTPKKLFSTCSLQQPNSLKSIFAQVLKDVFMLSIFWGVNNNREILAEAMHNPKESACEFLEYWYDGISKQTLWRKRKRAAQRYWLPIKIPRVRPLPYRLKSFSIHVAWFIFMEYEHYVVQVKFRPRFCGYRMWSEGLKGTFWWNFVGPWESEPNFYL